MKTIQEQLSRAEEMVWLNPNKNKILPNLSYSIEDIVDASQRLERFAPYIMEVFPETESMDGIIESPLTKIPLMQEALEQEEGWDLSGELYIKEDNALPISGSIKARGGIYEVLKLAETLAVREGLLTENDSYTLFNEPRMKDFFKQYKLAVSSTGNLGLSVGIMGARLGFTTTVHMSADAKRWKKELLREKGVRVLEYAGDFSYAVEQGRTQSSLDPFSHFIDDEDSETLFLGYAVAALRIQDQLQRAHIEISESNPLYVYLPCGVGGSPGGVSYGLNLLYGNAVKIIFVEPTQAPSMLLGLLTGLYNQISVQDIGLDGLTAADGLAVGRPSALVGELVEPYLTAITTVKDERLYHYLSLLVDTEKIWIEPSAASGFASYVDFQRKQHQEGIVLNGTHIVWSTGGAMVPQEEMEAYYIQGKKFKN